MGPLSRAVALVTIAVIAGAGVCLFDGGEPASADLCLAFLAASVAPILGFPLALASQIQPASRTRYALCPPDLSPPPPRG